MHYMTGKFSKKPEINIIVRISALASKMGLIKKIKAIYYINWYIIRKFDG